MLVFTQTVFLMKLTHSLSDTDIRPDVKYTLTTVDSIYKLNFLYYVSCPVLYMFYFIGVFVRHNEKLEQQTSQTLF